MKEQWERLVDVEPSDRFVCEYSGNFAQKLEINRPILEKFLSIASLDGRVLLKDSGLKRPQVIPSDINPDGSITGRGVLRWGQKVQTEVQHKGKYSFQVEPDDDGWAISINGDLITEELVKNRKQGVREVAEEFSHRFNYLTRVGLKESLLKDKLTLAKDPFLAGRVFGTYCLSSMLIDGITSMRVGPFILLGIMLNIMYSANTERLRMEHLKSIDLARSGSLPSWVVAGGNLVHSFERRTVENRYDGIAPPFELDRLIGAYVYLDYQKLRGNSLVRLARD